MFLNSMKSITIVVSLLLCVILPVAGVQVAASHEITCHTLDLMEYDILLIPNTYTETTPDTVTRFLTNMEPCPYIADDEINRCGSMTSYIVHTAHDFNLTLGGVTLTYVVGVCGGHRVPTFSHGGVQYYIANLNKYDTRVVDIRELREIMRDEVGVEGFGLDHHKTYRWD